MHRNRVVHEVSNELARMLGFARRDNTEEEFARSMAEDFVEPAMTIHENIISSISRYRFQMDTSHFQAGKRFGGKVADLKNVRLFDATWNSGPFSIEYLNPQPSAKDLRRRLLVVCSVCPGLMVTTISDQSTNTNETIACPERILVAWNPKETPNGQQSSSWLYNIVSALS